MTDILKENKDDIFFFINQISEFIEIADRIQRTADEIRMKQRNNEQIKNEEWFKFIDLSIDIVEYGFEIAHYIDNDIDYGAYLKVARASNELFRNVVSANYSLAITNVTDILDCLFSDFPIHSNSFQNAVDVLPELDSLKGKKISSLDSINKSDLKKYIKQIGKAKIENLNERSKLKAREDALVTLDFLLKRKKRIKTIGKVMQYSLFAANLVESKTEEQVIKVLENTTLPAGSSSIKKNSKLNVAIQSYLGPAFLIGRQNDLRNTENITAWNDDVNVHAPIGVSLSLGFGKAGSFSLYAPLLDLGAIVDYQLARDTVMTGPMQTVVQEKEYKIKLGQIFSPGYYAVYGFPYKIPISLGIGRQFGPGLTQIDFDSNETVINNPQWRWNIFLSVDIPLFNLYNVKKNYKM